MLFLAPPSHLSATLSTLPTLPQHAVTQAVRRDADDYALVPHYAEIVCSDDWPVQPFDFCVHRAAEEAPGEGGGDAGEQALDAREQGLRSPVILRFSVRAASLATPVAPISTIHSMASVWSRQTRILSWPPRSWNQKHPNFQKFAREKLVNLVPPIYWY